MTINFFANLLITGLAAVFIGACAVFLRDAYAHEITLRRKKSRLKETEDDLSELMREEDNQASD